MSAKIVNFVDFKIENLEIHEPVEKAVPKGPNAGLKYFEMPYKYNYGTKEAPVIADFLLEGPKQSTNYGISAKEMSGALKWSIGASLTRTKDHPHYIYMQAVTAIFKASSKEIEKHRGVLRFHDYEAEKPGKAFKNPLTPKRDAKGAIIAGSDISIYYAMLYSSHPYGANTLFTDLDDKPINWNILKGAQIEYIPLVKFDKIYIGNTASIQMKLQSAVITKISGRGTESFQKGTTQQIRESDPNYVESLREQIRQMELKYKSMEPCADSGIPDAGTPSTAAATQITNGTSTIKSNIEFDEFA